MCGKTMYKWCLVAFNVIFVLLGVITLACGLWVKYDHESVMSVMERLPANAQAATDDFDIVGLLNSAAVMLIVVGTIIFTVGFFGCCGAWKEVRLFLVIYAVILGVIFILQIAGVICWVFFKDKVNEFLLPFLDSQLREGYTQGVHFDGDELVISSDAATMAWDSIQFSLECCGVNGYEDYANASNWDNTYTYDGQTIQNAVVPLSCCRVENPRAFPDDIENINFNDVAGCLRDPASNNANLDGCYGKMDTLLENYSSYVIGVGIGILLIELLGMVLAFSLFSAIKKAEYKEV